MSFRLSLNEEVAAALNEQICIESSAAFLYFSMASWASVRGLTGMAKWFRTEAAGELTHMGLFVDYLNDRDYQAKFSTIEAPKATAPIAAVIPILWSEKPTSHSG